MNQAIEQNGKRIRSEISTTATTSKSNAYIQTYTSITAGPGIENACMHEITNKSMSLDGTVTEKNVLIYYSNVSYSYRWGE